MADYLERVKDLRNNTSQRQTQEQDLGAMLSELKKMQLAALMGGNQEKTTVVKIDQTDVADKLSAAIAKIGTLIQSMDSSSSDAEQLAALKKMHGIFDGYFKRVGSDTASIVAAIKALDLAPVIKAPIVTVPAPIVNVPAAVVQSAPVDLTGVERALERALTPGDVEASAPDPCDLSRYRAQDLTDNGDMQYVGFVNPEGNWYIIENDVARNRMRYVFGTRGYARHFRAAATYEYKLLDKAYSAAS